MLYKVMGNKLENIGKMCRILMTREMEIVLKELNGIRTTVVIKATAQISQPVIPFHYLLTLRDELYFQSSLHGQIAGDTEEKGVFEYV
jgi:hypothetical protein